MYGVNLTINSSPGTVFLLEEGATITFTNSDGDEVYAKDNVVVTNNSTAAIGVVCNPSTVTLNNNSSGTLTDTTSCSNVTYDYSNVGGPGNCGSISNGIKENEVNSLTIYPNPVVKGTEISIEVASAINLIEVYDLTGKQILAVPSGVNKLKTDELEPGHFILVLRTDAAIIRAPFIIL